MNVTSVFPIPSRDVLLNVRLTRAAGAMFLLALIVPTLHWAFVVSPLIVLGDVAATAANMIDDAPLYRTGIAIQLLLAAFSVGFAVILHTLLSRGGTALATFALSCKLVEAALLAGIALLSLVALALLDAPREGVPAQHLAGTLLGAHMVLMSIPMLFMGLGTAVFFWLFRRVGALPGPLALFGVLSYVLIVGHAVLTVLAPQIAANVAVQALCWGPSVLCEPVVGSWLLATGSGTGVARA